MARLGPDFSYKKDAAGRGHLEVHLRGNALLRMAATNKGTASTPRERRELLDEPLIRQMASNTARPVVFPLSNPTSSCEAIPRDIVHWTAGRAIIPTGIPFDDVQFGGECHRVGQANNVFVFPVRFSGMGFAGILGRCERISEAMITEAAFALAEFTAGRYLSEGRTFRRWPLCARSVSRSRPRRSKWH